MLEIPLRVLPVGLEQRRLSKLLRRLHKLSILGQREHEERTDREEGEPGPVRQPSGCLGQAARSRGVDSRDLHAVSPAASPKTGYLAQAAPAGRPVSSLQQRRIWHE